MKNGFRILTTSLGFSNLFPHFAVILFCHKLLLSRDSESSGCFEPPCFKNMLIISNSVMMKGRLPITKIDLPAGHRTVVGLLR